MKVILSAVDVASMLAAQWNLSPDDVTVHNVEEITIEIPATLLGLSEPQQQPKQRKPRTTTATTAALSRKAVKEAVLEEDLKDLEEELTSDKDEKEPAPKEEDSLAAFMDDDEEAFN